MKLKLEMDSVIFSLKIDNYKPNESSRRRDNWCSAEIVLNGRYIRWSGKSFDLQSSEIDVLRHYLRTMLERKLTKNIALECKEPFLSFLFHPYIDESADPVNAVESMDFIIHLWNRKGKVGNSSLSMNFNKEACMDLLLYLDLLAGTAHLTDEQYKLMLKCGKLHPDLHDEMYSVI